MSQYPYGHPHFPPQNMQGYPQQQQPNLQGYPQQQPNLQSFPQQQPNLQGFPQQQPNLQVFPQQQPNLQGYPQAPTQNQLYPQVPPLMTGVNYNQAPAAMSYPGMATAPPPCAPLEPGFAVSPLPAVSPTPVYPGFGVSADPVEWIPSTCALADAYVHRAIVGGYEGHDGSPLWVIRAPFEGDVIPGKLAIKHKSAYVAWGGNENSVQNFEVCCAPAERVKWVESRDGALPPKAIAGGRTKEGETLYIGRAKHQGSLTPGKIHPSHKVLYISFGGQELPHKVYEVLCSI